MTIWVFLKSDDGAFRVTGGTEKIRYATQTEWCTK